MLRVKSKLIFRIPGLVLVFLSLAGCAFRLNPHSLPSETLNLPARSGKITFGKFVYDFRLNKILIPGGETGSLYIVEAESKKVQAVSGFAQSDTASQPNSRVAAATTARGILYVIERSAKKIVIIDPASGKTLNTQSVQAVPDDIAFVAAVNEIWVAEKEVEQVEIFKILEGDPPALERTGEIHVPKGPEGLVVDRTRGLAYTNQPEIGQTAVIQVMTHGTVAEWGNGCSKARGMAIDEDNGFLFVACQEGKLVMMDINNNGSQLASQIYGGDLNGVAYDPKLRHVYLPSGASSILAIFAVEKKQAQNASAAPATDDNQTGTTPSEMVLVRLGTVDTSPGANCVSVDMQRNILVCDPDKGQLFLFRDTFSSGES